MDKYLAFLCGLYELTHNKPTMLSLRALTRDYNLANRSIVSVALQKAGILEVTKATSRRRFYFWIAAYPDKSLALSLDKTVKVVCRTYNYLHASKNNETIPNHIATTNKYVIPFAANDLRYVNTIEEGIELISSAIVAAGDYNIYQLVAKVQKVSKLNITKI